MAGKAKKFVLINTSSPSERFSYISIAYIILAILLFSTISLISLLRLLALIKYCGAGCNRVGGWDASCSWGSDYRVVS